MILGISCQVIHGLDQYDTEPPAGSAATQATGTGGTSTSSAGGNGGSGTGTGGQGGGPPPDPCTGSEPGVCLPTFPEQDGWTGYFLLYSTDVAAGPMTCPDAMPPMRFYAPSAEPATCDLCMCGSAAVTCQGAILAWEDTACLSGNSSNYIVMEPCANTGANANGIQALGATTAVSCPNSGGAATVGALWGMEHTLCNAAALPEGECTGDEVCIENANLKTCIKADGDVPACPVGWEDATHYQFYDMGGATDTRNCSACVCTPLMTDLCSGGTYEVFTNPTCGDPSINTLAENAPCLSAVNSLSVSYNVTPGSTSCTTIGGEPTGFITPGPVATTLCCRP